MFVNVAVDYVLARMHSLLCIHALQSIAVMIALYISTVPLTIIASLPTAAANDNHNC